MRIEKTKTRLDISSIRIQKERGILMKTEQQYFEEGKSIQTYMNDMSTLKEESLAVYEQFQLPKRWTG